MYGYKREEGQSLSTESLYHLKVMNRRGANKEIKKECPVSAVQWRAWPLFFYFFIGRKIAQELQTLSDLKLAR